MTSDDPLDQLSQLRLEHRRNLALLELAYENGQRGDQSLHKEGESEEIDVYNANKPSTSGRQFYQSWEDGDLSAPSPDPQSFPSKPIVIGRIKVQERRESSTAGRHHQHNRTDRTAVRTTRGEEQYLERRILRYFPASESNLFAVANSNSRQRRYSSVDYHVGETQAHVYSREATVTADNSRSNSNAMNRLRFAQQHSRSRQHGRDGHLAEVNSVGESIDSTDASFSVSSDDSQSHLVTSPPSRSQSAALWTPKITIPQPFQMTLREERGSLRKKSFSLSNLRPAEASASNDPLPPRRSSFRARPVPPSTYLPLFQEMNDLSEEKRKQMKTRSVEMLSTKVKPFNLTPKKKNMAGRKTETLQVFRYPHQDDLLNDFRAAPVPRQIYSSKIDHDLSRKEAERLIRIKRRARYLLDHSGLPGRMEMRSAARSELDSHQRCHTTLPYRPSINRSVPDFAKLHKKLDTNPRTIRTTVPVPFVLETEIRKHYHYHAKETTTTTNSKSDNYGSRSNLRKAQSLSSLNPKNLMPIRTTNAMELRVKAIRDRQLKNANSRKGWCVTKAGHEFEQEAKRKLDMHLMEEGMRQKLDIVDRREKYRELDRDRRNNFQHELEEMERRIASGPSVLERQEMLIKKQSIERRYRKIMENSGIDPDRIPTLSRFSEMESGPRSPQDDAPGESLRESLNGSKESIAPYVNSVQTESARASSASSDPARPSVSASLSSHNAVRESPRSLNMNSVINDSDDHAASYQNGFHYDKDPEADARYDYEDHISEATWHGSDERSPQSSAASNHSERNGGFNTLEAEANGIKANGTILHNGNLNISRRSSQNGSSNNEHMFVLNGNTAVQNGGTYRADGIIDGFGEHSLTDYSQDRKPGNHDQEDANSRTKGSGDDDEAIKNNYPVDFFE